MAKKKEKSPADAKPDVPKSVQITSALLNHAVHLATESGATSILVYAEALPEDGWDLPDDMANRVIYATRTPEAAESLEAAGKRTVPVPNVNMTRLGQIKMAVLLGLSRGLLKSGDTIVCLAGIGGKPSLDTLVVMEVGAEFEMFLAPDEETGVASGVNPEVLERVINIAAELGAEGREGKPVGTLFVIGDTERVKGLSKQMILNPFQGYPPDKRNILDESIEETVKELATIDGAFLIYGDGVIESCGTFLKTAAPLEFELTDGLGTRHQAAAAITSVTDSFAVAVSESTGTVTIFRRGRIVTEIEKPRSQRAMRRRSDA